jgi:DNA end-binding protein Ku
MKSIWNGTIRFGLVHIPVKVVSATRSQELHFHYLHERDCGRVKSQRICTKCGQVLDADDLVRGYEYEKGKYVPLAEEDFARVEVESSDTVPILTFVDPEDIDPLFFNKPYYLVPDKNGESLYTLLREALKQTHKVAIAKLAFHEREHVVVITPNGRALMLDVLYFADEISPPKGMALPKQHGQIEDEELALAKQLIGSMSGQFQPEQYKDSYREGLLALIDKKVEGEEIKTTPKRRAAPSNVVDLMAALKASIQKAEGKRKGAVAA